LLGQKSGEHVVISIITNRDFNADMAMTFYIQGLNGHEVMPLTHLFDERSIEKTQNIDTQNRVNPTKHRLDEQHLRRGAGDALNSYYEIEQLPKGGSILQASQIMTTQVDSLKSTDLVSQAFELFQSRKIHHVPIVTESGLVEGIISDRNILHYLCGITGDYVQHEPSARLNDRIASIMKTKVLTASLDTDVRYIARLFVERRVGSTPIVEDGKLLGIVTRSDILTAVMRHFIYELWA